MTPSPLHLASFGLALIAGISLASAQTTIYSDNFDGTGNIIGLARMALT